MPGSPAFVTVTTPKGRQVVLGLAHILSVVPADDQEDRPMVRINLVGSPASAELRSIVAFGTVEAFAAHVGSTPLTP